MKNLISEKNQSAGCHQRWITHLGRMKLGTLELIHSELLQRFDGWHQNFCGELAAPDPAMLPASPGLLLDTSDLSRDMTLTDLIRVAQYWEQADCFIWAARSHRLHRNWDPLIESFSAFQAADPQCALYTLGLDPLCPEATVQQLLGFIHIQGALLQSSDYSTEPLVRHA